MSASPGSLDGFSNYTFSFSQLNAISQVSVTAIAGYFNAADAYVPPALETVTATATGTPFLPESDTTFTVTGVNDAANSITVAEKYDGQVISNATYYVIAFSPGAILVSLGDLAPELAGYASSPAALSELSGSLAIIATTALPEGTNVTFDATGSTNLVACFALGTRIRTARGDVAVQDLREGDLVPTLVAEGLSRVRWVGRRTLDVARSFRPWDVAPVRVCADAFAPGLPSRDLLLSPDHAVMLNGALMPIRYLLNGATIAQEPAEKITYFHVELDRHDVLLAEGLPCESFLDTGNRGAFGNAPGPVDLAPDFARRVWAEQGCLPLLTEGEAVAAARENLAQRAGSLGWRMTPEPALQVMAAGRVLPAARQGDSWRVVLPADAVEIHLRSRAIVPAQRVMGGDRRRLGVALADLRLDDAPAPPAAFRAGWHADEGDLRWTDGDARLAVRGSRELCFRLAWHEQYWLPPVTAEATPIPAALAG